MIVGVDNGLNGGLCAVSRHDGSIIDKLVTPTHSPYDKKEIDIRAIYKWLEEMNTPFVMAVEEPLKHAKSSQSIRSMSISFGKFLGLAECKQFSIARIAVTDWQKAMLGRIPKSQSKKLALLLANKLAPDEDWRATPRCKVPHDGLIDAFLIARFYLQISK